MDSQLKEKLFRLKNYPSGKTQGLLLDCLTFAKTMAKAAPNLAESPRNVIVFDSASSGGTSTLTPVSRKISDRPER